MSEPPLPRRNPATARLGAMHLAVALVASSAAVYAMIGWGAATWWPGAPQWAPIPLIAHACGLGFLLFAAAAHARAGMTLRWETVYVHRGSAVMPLAALVGVVIAAPVVWSGTPNPAVQAGLGPLCFALLVGSLISLVSLAITVGWAVAGQGPPRQGTRQMFPPVWWAGYTGLMGLTTMAVLLLEGGWGV